jgi:hypothetical protein
MAVLSMSETSLSWSRVEVGPGWARMVLRVPATTLTCPLGTSQQVVLKWTRHGCQAAPENVLRIAAFSPVGVSEIFSTTPWSPRFLRRRKVVQNTSSSVSPTSKSKTSRLPSAATPVANSMCLWSFTPLHFGH